MYGYTLPFNYLKILSWIILTEFDTNLNIHWQNYYGGDVNYQLNTVLATTDSGFIMACSRYDHNIQNNEYGIWNRQSVPFYSYFSEFIGLSVETFIA